MTNFAQKRSSTFLVAILVVGIVLSFMLGQTVVSQAQSGSSLLVSAVASPFTAATNNADRAFVFVTVQSSAGLVGGLSGINFVVFAEQLAVGGCLVSVIQSRQDENRPGVYRLDLVPGAPNCTWQHGTYVLSVSVKIGSQSGAALASMTIN